jgi:hypothetical protein
VNDFYVGVDPGLTGAAALFDGQTILDVFDLKTRPNGQLTGFMKKETCPDSFREKLHEWVHRFDLTMGSVSFMIERPIARPGLPAQTIACQFDTFGVLRGVLNTLPWSGYYASPNEWKALLGIGSDKILSLKIANMLFSREYSLKRHDRAEAVLISLYLDYRLNYDKS